MKAQELTGEGSGRGLGEPLPRKLKKLGIGNCAIWRTFEENVYTYIGALLDTISKGGNFQLSFSKTGVRGFYPHFFLFAHGCRRISIHYRITKTKFLLL